MKHILNVIKDIFDSRDHVVAPNVPSDIVKVDFRSKVPWIKDQGQAGSCTGNAISANMETLYRMQPSELAKKVDVNTLRFSALFLYGQERMKMGTFDQDSGSDSRTGMQILASIGCCLEPQDPYSDRNIYIAPTKDQIAEAALYKIGSYHRIPDVATAKTVLMSNYTFSIGIPVFNQLESDEAASTGMIAMPSGNPIGGHELHVVGADDSMQVLDQLGAFIVQNSWGATWGDKGFCYIPYAYFNKLSDEIDMWCCHFGKPWKPVKAN